MNYLILYAFMSFSPAGEFEMRLPELKQPCYDAQLGFREFQGNKEQKPFSWNTLSIKDCSCTVAEALVTLDEKNKPAHRTGKFEAALKILYLKIGTI